MVPAPTLPADPKRVNRTKKAYAAPVACQMKHPIVRIMMPTERVCTSDADKANAHHNKSKQKAFVARTVKKPTAVNIIPPVFVQVQHVVCIPIAQKSKSIQLVPAARPQQNLFAPARMLTALADLFIVRPNPGVSTCPLMIQKFVVLKAQRRFAEITTPTALAHNMDVKIIPAHRKKSGCSAVVVKPGIRRIVPHTHRTERVRQSIVNRHLVTKFASIPSPHVV